MNSRAEESRLKSILDKLENSHPSNSLLDISASGDISGILGAQQDKFHAILDPESNYVNLVLQEAGSKKGRTIKTKIKLINNDNSMLMDTS